MEFNYLYIDDSSRETAAGIITGLEEASTLSVTYDNPKGDWEEERERILSQDFKRYNGLILDLNLEDMPNEEKKLSKYKGSSLASEIRNISKSGELKEMPIVLLSATYNLKKYFDKTNEDLFDLIVSREILGNIYPEIRMKLIALANGYDQITAFKESHNLEGLLQFDLNSIDIRFLGEVDSIKENPTHSISNFFIKNLISKDGILISKEILAARLGIDLIKSDDKKVILESLNNYKYYGVFSEGWERWWMIGIEEWWKTIVGCDKGLRTLSATERVDIMKSKFTLSNLFPIEKDTKSKSDCFWTVCTGSKIAIDTIDGLLIANQDNIFPWQDKSYISFEEALNPQGKPNWERISPTEKFKLEQLRKLYPNERPNQQ